jgi:hypothetical protein
MSASDKGLDILLQLRPYYHAASVDGSQTNVQFDERPITMPCPASRRILTASYLQNCDRLCRVRVDLLAKGVSFGKGVILVEQRREGSRVNERDRAQKTLSQDQVSSY